MDKNKTPVEKYLEHLDKIFQAKPEFFKYQSEIKGIPGITAIIYRDIPEKGMITGVTYGLSLADHPEFKNGRPELIISVDSEDISWGKAVAFLANSLRGNCPFRYGDTINFKQQITADSKMDSFLIFIPAILEKPDFLNIDIGLDYKINLTGLYPIYDTEKEFIKIHGLEKFWHHKNFDMYNVRRKQVQE